MSLRFVLLALLSKEANTGYGLGRLLQDELHHLWDARLQQIYSELARLRADNLVDVEYFDLPNRPAKKRYSLTMAGFEALDAWLAERPAEPTSRDELLVQLHCLERIPPSTAIQRLRERRERSEEEASRLRRLLDPTPRDDISRLGDVLTLERALAHAEIDVAWYTRVIDALREALRSAGPSESWPETALRAISGARLGTL